MTAIVTKIPELRFPEFEGEWEEKRLGEVFDFYQTNSFSRSLLSYEKGNVKNIHYGDIHTKFRTSFDVSKEDVPFVDESVDISRIADANYCKVGDLVIADASEDYKDIGKAIEVVSLAGYKLLAGLHTLIVRDVKNQTATGFKGYMMQTRSIRLQVMRMATGISVLGISKGNLAKIILLLPSISEQQRIAAFLTTIDTRIQQLSRKKAMLEQYKKGVMQQIFSQEIRFKDEEGKEFPAWEEKQLGAVFTFCQTNSLSRSLLNYERGAVKNIHYGDIHTKFPTIFDLSKEEVPFINESVDLSKIADENYCKVGDLIIADASEDYKDVGKAIEVVNLAGQTLLAGLHTLIVRDVKNYTVTGFKGYMMQTYDVRHQIMRLATGVSVLGISKGNLSKVKVPLPSLSEQQKIASFLFTFDRQINLVSQQLERMKTFKKGLLQQMFV